ncbi:MAG: helix-turn-helix transcriptional regulator [Dehalococcoidia bacterium]
MTRIQVRVYVRQDFLATELARRNISLQGLARGLKVSPGYVSQLLRGTRCPSPEVRERLQRLLRIEDFDRLFRLEEG